MIEPDKIIGVYTEGEMLFSAIKNIHVLFIVSYLTWDILNIFTKSDKSAEG